MSLEYHIKLNIAKRFGRKADEGKAHDKLGHHYLSLGKYDKALEHFKMCIYTAKQLGDKIGEGVAYGGLADCYSSLGQYDKASEHFKIWLDIAKQLGERAGEGRAHGGLGYCYSSIGQYDKALEHYKMWLKIAKQLAHKADEGRANGGLGGCYSSLGQYNKASEYFKMYLDNANQIGDLAGEGEACGGLGDCFSSLGQYDKASQYFKMWLDIARERGEKTGEGRAYGGLGDCYSSLGQYDKASEYYEMWLKISRQLEHKTDEGRACGGLGSCYSSLGQYNEALEHFKMWLDIAKQIGDKADEGRAYGGLGGCYYSLGQYEKALEHFKMWFDIAKQIGDKTDEEKAYGGIEECYSACFGRYDKAAELYTTRLDTAEHIGDEIGAGMTGQYAKALELYKLHLDIAKQTGDTTGEGLAYGDLGDCYYSLGQYDKASEHFKMCLDTAKQIGDKADEGRACGGLGSCYSSLGQYDKALEHFKIWLDIAKQLGDKADEGKAYGGLGSCYSSLGQYDKALKHFKMWLYIAKQMGDKADEGRAYGGLGGCYSSLGQYDEALEHFKMWVKIAKQTGDKADEGRANGGLGDCYSSLGQCDKALEHFKMWFDIAKQIGDKAGEGRAYGGLGGCYYSLGQYEKALKHFKMWFDIAKQMGDKAGEGRAYGGLANCYSSLGQYGKASEHCKMWLRIAKQIGAKANEERACSDLAGCYFSLGQFDKALEYYRLCLNIAKQIGDKASEKRAYGDLARCYSSLGQYDKASDCQKMCITTVRNQVGNEKVPVEILARGPKAVEAFQKALSEGKTRVRRVPIMLIGQERAGKTSLLKSLKGETFDPHVESTRGITIDPCLCKVTQEIWKAGQGDDEDVTAAVSFEHHAAVLTCKYLVASQESGGNETLNGEEKHVAELESDSSLKHDSRDDSNTGQVSGPASPDSGSSPFESGLEDVKEETWMFPVQLALLVDTRDDPDVQPATEPMASNIDTSTNNKSDVPEEIIALIEKLMQKEELEDDNDIYCTLWDFAGQSVFYTTHSLFLTHRAIYILVNDLSKSPDQETDPLRKQGLFRRPYDDPNFVRTNLDFLHYWMTSIASFSSNENIASEEFSVSLPPVIFVSTHADEPFGDASPRDLAREIFGSLQEKSYKSHLVDDFFVVDNTRSGSGDEDKEVPRLRDKILKLCRELQKWQVDFPLKWLKFEKTLKAAVREGFHSLKLSEAKKIGLDVCGITDKNEFRAVLDFLHDQRILVHFDDSAELDDLVVLDPQWLIDILKEVITVKPFESEQSAFVEHWRELEESGVLKRELLEHVWSHLLNQRNTIEALVSIMEKFNLLCRWSSSSTEEYLVPHMLKSLPVSKELAELLSSAVVPSLFIRFPSVQDPQFCFLNLVVCLINEWTKEQPCFKRPKLYRNFVRFSLNPSDGSSLVLFCHSSVIEVALCAPSTPSGCFIETTCGRVVRVLRRALEHMRLGCLWLKSMSYELCFRCPVCYTRVADCTKQERGHFFSEKEILLGRQPVICDRSEVAMDTTVPSQMFLPWLGEKSLEYGADGVLEMALSLPDNVMSILQSADQNCTTIVQTAAEHFQLDVAALAEPSADTRQKVRGLAHLMKRSNRADVVRHLRTLVPSGTTGPLLDERLPVNMMPHEERRELTVFLSGREQWKDVASKLGLSNDEILFLDRRTRNPADAMLDELKLRNPNCTVGYLYDVLVEIDMAVAADIM